MKQISTEKINSLLQVIYTTSISAQQFDAIKKLLSELPDVVVKKEETPA